MEKAKVLKGLCLLGGPIGWSIAGLVYAEDLRRMYCKIRKQQKKEKLRL